MKINEKISGFTLISTNDASEISAKLNIFEHESGARLCFIEREDNNLSFAIGFKTPPKDSTGVFHIIEHSVLCGSKKFPVKEPFVELLKGSLNTFLNAMTYEDKTVYPVSSRCEADFYNLTDVYLDAVFHPLMLSEKAIFEQEGHHLEYDEKTDSLKFSGVVFNEMQGVYSSPDDLSGAVLSKMLFEGSIYEHDSGGAPDAIPSLTYEDFCNSHKTYYRPENAYIVLDGSINLEKTLALIDSYLSEFIRGDFKVETEYPAPKICPIKTVYYEAGEEDNGKGKLLFSTVFGKVSEKEKNLAIALLMDVLAGSNEAPLKKELLSSGLCDDVSLYANKTCVNTITLELHGINAEDAEKLTELVKSALKGIIDNGIEKGQLRASLSRLKFRTRERDFGSLPKGIAFALTVMEGWLYGVDPMDTIAAEDALDFLESKIDTDYFEKLLLEATLDSVHKATLLMLPSQDESEFSKKLSVELSALHKKMTKAEIDEIIASDKALKLRQGTPDTKDALSKIPALKVSDIKETKTEIKTEISKLDGAVVLHHNVDIKGILYTELYFSAENLTKEELTGLTILSSLLTNLDTENHTASELRDMIKLSLGSFMPNALSYTHTKAHGKAIPLFTISASALTENADKLIEIIKEVLLYTKFDDKDKIKKILTQIRSATEDTVLASGDGISIERVEGALTDSGTVNEEISGITAYRRIKEYEKNFDKECDILVSMLKSLYKKLFTKIRLTVSVAGDAPLGFGTDVVKLFDAGAPFVSKAPAKCDCSPRKEAVVLPIRISHAAMGFCSEVAAEKLGVFKVARTILSYEYLWTKVRVMGGAYGAGFIARRHGSVMFYSYRDPKPKNSLDVFLGASEFLTEFLSDDPDLTKYIIGAYGDVDILMTPKTAARQKTADYLTGWTEEDEKKMRRDMISTDKNALLEVAKMINDLSAASFTVVCGKDTANSLGEVDKIIP